MDISAMYRSIMIERSSQYQITEKAVFFRKEIDFYRLLEIFLWFSMVWLSSEEGFSSYEGVYQTNSRSLDCLFIGLGAEYILQQNIYNFVEIIYQIVMSKNNIEDKIKGPTLSDQTVLNVYSPSPPHPQHIGAYYPFHQLYGYLYPNTATPPLDYYNRPYNPYDYYSSLPSVSLPFQNEREQLIKQQCMSDQQSIKVKVEVPEIEEKPKVKMQRSEEDKSLQNKKNKSEKQDAWIESEALLAFPKPYVLTVISDYRNLLEGLLADDVHHASNVLKLKLEFSQRDAEFEGSELPLSQEYLVNRANIFDSILEELQKKYKSFKKTKEEMIKYIIRRTYHNLKINKALYDKPQYERLEHFHQRNLSSHKSMNVDFLKKEFSNQLFVTIFKRFVAQMDAQLKEENDERIQKFSYVLAKCWLLKTNKYLVHQRKLPWINSYKEKVKQIAVDMLKEYQGYCEKEEVLDRNAKK